MGEKDFEKCPPRILIVDDVEINRLVLRNIILDMGYQPVLAENGLDALESVRNQKPNLILLDIAMPKMDGYEFCTIIKKDPGTRNIPIIFISAYDDPKDVIKGFEMGGEDYVTKPFIRAVVKARVNVHLKLYDTTQQLLESNRRLQVSVNEQLRQMEQEKKTVLYALAGVARENACYSEDYWSRLQSNCKILAQAFQLSPKYESMISDGFIDNIEWVAPLCDLGNVSIPRDILSKEGGLTEEERAIMQTHTELGARILEGLKSQGDYNDFVQMAIEIAKCHHENWDGSGYPKGLKKDKIPLAAQIVALAVSFCALTENRSYRKAYSVEQALEIMEKDVGIKFSPDTFFILKKIYRQLK